MSQLSPSNRVIPIPQNFPVQWSDPADAQLLWTYNPAYYGKPMPPLDFALGAKPALESSNKIFAASGLPMQSRVCQINGYVYSAAVVTDSNATSVDTLSQAELAALIGKLKERWSEKWLPEIKSHLAAWEAFDLAGATLSDLLAHLDETEQRIYQLQEIHLELGVAMFTALHHFEQMMEDLFPTDSNTNSTVEAIDSYALLAGFETRGMQSSQALWQLSRLALMEPELYWVLRETATEEVLAALTEFDEGEEFLAELDSYLQEFGYQGEKNYLSQPTWREEPTPAIQTLQAYLAQPERNFAAELRATATRRERAVAAVRKQLDGYPQPMIDHFEFLLEAAQTATWLREEHPHWLDLRLYDHARQVILAVGKHLCAAGAIAAVNDIFYLTLAEVRALCTEIIGAGKSITTQHRLVTTRRTTLAHYAAQSPPSMLGTLPTEQPPNHPLLSALAHNSGTSVAPTSTQAGVLHGHAASSGIIRGRARLLSSPAEAAKLNTGDILVTVTTGPAWTPLYANLAGLVTDTGGLLSHAAVVAREFGIPAVVGVGAATTLIKDGQLIEIDGHVGIVRLALGNRL